VPGSRYKSSPQFFDILTNVRLATSRQVPLHQTKVEATSRITLQHHIIAQSGRKTGGSNPPLRSGRHIDLPRTMNVYEIAVAAAFVIVGLVGLVAMIATSIGRDDPY
jgi:hypothetical protein